MYMKSNRRYPLPFRYPGGKHYAIDILRPFWLSIKHDEYREPLVGGGSVFFNKPKSRFNWLNDIDYELVKTYQVIADNNLRHALIRMVGNEVATKERWKEISKLCPKDDLEIAYKYFYLNRTSFSGKMISGAWGYRPKRSLPPNRWYERIKAAGRKLEEVTITNLDFATILDAPSKGETTLIYIDPPYYSPPRHKHYRYGFSLDDHVRLAETLRNVQHYFFLTYDDVPEVRGLYRWANIYDANFYYRVDNSNVQNGSRQVGFELIITNYEVQNQLLLVGDDEY